MITYCRQLWLRHHVNYHIKHCFKWYKCLNETHKCHKSSSVTSSSALYINHQDLSNVQVYEVDLELDEMFKDLAAIKSNMKARQMENTININELAGKYETYRHLSTEKSKLETERKLNSEMMKTLVVDAKKFGKTENLVKEENQLRSRGQSIKKQFKAVEKQWWDAEESLMLDVLRLPVLCHESTPSENEVLLYYGDIPEIQNPINHVDLGVKKESVDFIRVSPSAYYLKKDLAKMELKLINHFTSHLTSCGFTQFSSPDFVKTAVIEGCGYDFKDPTQVLSIEPSVADMEHYKEREGLENVDIRDWHKWDVLQHLTGSASVSAFAGFMAKHLYSSESLPLKYFSVGRRYHPVRDDVTVSLLNVTQSNSIELLGAACDRVQEQDLYHTITYVLWDSFKQLKLPVRLMKVGSPNLKHMQAARTDIQVWIPSMQQYITAADIMMCNDFISRRLMMKHSKDVKNILSQHYINTVHGSAVNIPVILAAYMENYQTKEGRYELPTLY